MTSRRDFMVRTLAKRVRKWGALLPHPDVQYRAQMAGAPLGRDIECARAKAGSAVSKITTVEPAWAVSGSYGARP